MDNPREATTVDAHVGARIEVRRKQVGISQTVLADAIGMSDKQLRKYTTGRNRVSAGTLLSIAQVLDVQVGYFFEGLSLPSENSPEAPYSTDAAAEQEGDNTLDLKALDETEELARSYHAMLPNRKKAFRQMISAIAAHYEGQMGEK